LEQKKQLILNNLSNVQNKIEQIISSNKNNIEVYDQIIDINVHNIKKIDTNDFIKQVDIEINDYGKTLYGREISLLDDNIYVELEKEITSTDTIDLEKITQEQKMICDNFFELLEKYLEEFVETFLL